ncbi:MAG TPA: hypothetical protein VEB67_00465 [Nitrososphaerales archaeon]|nr:hypothetical protein [Nitrososphaerales archaeon]
MPLVYGCIAPHGGELIPALAGRKGEAFSPTRKGMRAIANQMQEAKPDTIVVATPHNLRLLKHIGVVLSENMSGTLSEGDASVTLRARCDQGLGKRVVSMAERRGLPVVGANFGALEGPMSDLAMDWGTLVPLWFFGRRRECRVLVVTPSRGLPLAQNLEFGKVVAHAAEEARERIAFVASADQAHAHLRDGPYGYSPRAKEYDQLVIDAISGNSLASIMRMSRDLVEAAKPDSLWQMSMLAGALEVVKMDPELLSYQVPTYYGMLCAGFRRPA